MHVNNNNVKDTKRLECYLVNYTEKKYKDMTTQYLKHS